MFVPFIIDCQSVGAAGSLSLFCQGVLVAGLDIRRLLGLEVGEDVTAIWQEVGVDRRCCSDAEGTALSLAAG